LEWLNAQLSEARAHHERVWFLGHIPPGVNLYASARRLVMACSVNSVQNFLASDSLATALAENTDIVPLPLFGHTHSDQIRLLSTLPRSAPSSASVTPVDRSQPPPAGATLAATARASQLQFCNSPRIPTPARSPTPPRKVSPPAPADSEARPRSAPYPEC